MTFLAEHLPTGKHVCIKQEATDDKDAKKLFKQEALILWDLHHESLVPIKDYFEIEVQGELFQFISMNFIEGLTLQRFVQKHGFIDDEHICWIMQACLKAFAYMHYHRVIHGDIKPDNMMFQLKEHNIVLVDFGMAVQGVGMKMRAKGGTPFYIPPEFRNGRPPLPESDIYSLGKSALFLAGGNPAVETGIPPKDMHPVLASIISRMVRRDITARPRSAHAVHQLISDFRRTSLGRGESQEILKFRDGKIIKTVEEADKFLEGQLT